MHPAVCRSGRPARRTLRPWLGVLPDFRKDPAGYLLNVAREHGDLAYMRLGPQHAFVVSHPEAIRDILVTNQSNFTKSRMLERAKVLLGDGLLTSEGEFHTRQRRLVQPAFHRDRLVRYSADMVACAERTGKAWSAGAEFDMHREMTRLTLAIVGRTLFSADVSSDADEIGRAMTQIFGLFDTLLLPFSDWIQKLPIPPVRRFEKARDQLDKIVYGLIAERRASGKDAGDLLSMLLLAQDEDDKGHMTDKQVRDEALTLLIAGHETTANALTWTWYLLSQNPQVEARMHDELDRVLGRRLPGFEDLPRLPYTAGVFAESLRLFPPAWAIGRRAKTELCNRRVHHPGEVDFADEPVGGASRSRVGGRSRSGLTRIAGILKKRPSVPSSRTSRLVEGRGCASARDSHGRRECWCWRRSRSGGRCGWFRGIRWRRER